MTSDYLVGLQSFVKCELDGGKHGMEMNAKRVDGGTSSVDSSSSMAQE